MGKMKELYMELREKFGDELPEDFSLAEYQFKKELEYEEIREMEERFKKDKVSSQGNDEKSQRDT
jgi:hypothetical protein